MTDLPLFMLTLSLAGLFLGGVISERKEGATALRVKEQEARTLFHAARRQAQELALLDQVRTALTQALDLPFVFRTVVEAVAQTFGYTQVSLYLVQEEMLRLEHQVGYEQVPDPIPLGAGIMGRVARTGTPALVEDVQTDPAYLAALAGVVSEVCVPLVDQGQVVGVLNVESTHGVRLTEADLQLMTALSEHIGIAIARARLYSAARENERKYRSVVENANEVIFQTDLDGRWTLLNPAWTAITGFSLPESIGKPFVEFIYPDDQANYAGRFVPLLAGDSHFCRCEFRCLTKEGGFCWMEVDAQPIWLADGTSGGATGLLNDITARRAAEEALRQQNAELAALHETTLGLVEQLDPTNLLEAIITRAAALTSTPNAYLYVVEPGTQEMVIRVGTGVFAPQIGYRLPRGQGLGGRVWETGELMTVPDYNNWPDRARDLEHLNLGAIVGIPLRDEGAVIGVIGLAYPGEVRTIGPDEIALLSRFGQMASLALKNARLYAAAQQELEERTRAEATLAHLALHDPLTDLPNRTLLYDRLQQALLAAQRSGQAVALLVMDLDRFKEVNDTLGHDLGDVLLRQVGQRLQGSVRAADTVARLGGDEFAVLLPTAEGRAASRIARKLLKTLEQPFELAGRNLDVRISIGIAICPDHGNDAETLLRRADVAMYIAKRSSSGYAVYSADQDPYSPSRLSLIGELRRAIEQDQLALHYQPKVSHKTGRPTGVEALVCWPHPEHGLLRADKFIPLAEHTGLIRPLSSWVLNAALGQCRAWQEQGLTLPVAVNLSTQDLHDPQLPDIIITLLASWGLAPPLLRVEITEGAAMADPQRTLSVLTRLRATGVQLAIDDFGTGYSSLAYLKRLPVDQIKIDRSFVREMTVHDNDAVIVRSTIDLAHNLGLVVVAEGIEDRPTWDLLTTLGCDEGQGYYLSHPLPPADLIYWVRSHEAGRTKPVLEPTPRV